VRRSSKGDRRTAKVNGVVERWPRARKRSSSSVRKYRQAREGVARRNPASDWERAAIMYGRSRKTDPMDDRGEASTSVSVERRARNVMPRRHDAAFSKERGCERSVSGAWRSGIIARWSPASCCRRCGGDLRKRIVRAVMRQEDSFVRGRRITDRDEQRRALKESSPAATGVWRSSMRGSQAQAGSGSLAREKRDRAREPRKRSTTRVPRSGRRWSSKEDRSRAERRAVIAR
jgi:hypothetical protein